MNGKGRDDLCKRPRFLLIQPAEDVSDAMKLSPASPLTPLNTQHDTAANKSKKGAASKSLRVVLYEWFVLRDK